MSTARPLALLRRAPAARFPRKRFPAALSLLATLAALAPLGADPASSDADWPRWRGVDGRGVWSGARLPEKLDASRVRELWSAPIGGGYAGIAVAGGRVYTLDRPGKDSGKERTLCFDRTSGKTLWVREHAADYGDLDYGNGPRATPAVHDGRVYAVGAVGRLRALDAESGEVIWEIDAKEKFDAVLPMWGHAVSPVIAGDLVFVQLGGRPEGILIALDRKTGEVRWRAIDERPGYSTPILAGNDRDRTLIHWTADALHGLDALSGRPRWSAPFRTSDYDVAIISPLEHQGQVFASGYWDGSRAFRLEAGEGKVEVRAAWSQERALSCLMSTPLLRDGVLYALDRRDGLIGLEWSTGKVLWTDKHKLTPAGRNPQASLVWAGESGARAMALNAQGELVMLELTSAGPKDLGRAPIIGFTWAHPAYSGQDVFARSDEKIVCVRIEAAAAR